MSEESQETGSSRLSTTDLCRTIQSELQNMGRALTCPLCLSTYRQAVILPRCCHAYCQDCLVRALQTQSKCPTCQQKCQRRSLVQVPLLNELVQAYKLALRHFGLAPIRYEPSAPMTQIVDPHSQQSDDYVNAHEHLQVARTFARSLQGSSDRKSIALLHEQQQVIAVNRQAVLDAAVTRQTAPSFSQILNSSLEQQAADVDLEEKDSQVRFAMQDTKMPARESSSQDGPFYSAVEDVVSDEPALTKQDSTTKSPPDVNQTTSQPEEQGVSAATGPSVSSSGKENAPNPSSEETVDPDTPFAKKPFDFSGIESDDDDKKPNDSVQEERKASRRRMSSIMDTCGLFDSDDDDDERNVLPPSSGNSNKEGEGKASSDETMEDVQDAAASHDEKTEGKDKQSATNKLGILEDVENQEGGSSETEANDAVMDQDNQEVAPRETATEDFPMEDAANHQEVAAHETATPDGRMEPTAENQQRASGEAAMEEAPIDEVAERPEHASRANVAAPDSESEPEDMTETQIQRARPVFDIGSVVRVQARTWPGVNKQGGVGRVTRVHELPGGSVAYDVAYVLGGKEKKVDDTFVSLQENEFETTVVEKPERGSSRGRKSHRIAKLEDEIPPQLLEQLAAEGFDTKGVAVPSRTAGVVTPAEAKENSKSAKKERNKTKRRPQREKEETQPSKRRKIGKAISSRLTKFASKARSEKTNIASASLPEISDEEKCATADVLYKNRIESAMKKSLIHVVASGLSDHDMESLRALCKDMKKNKGKGTRVNLTRLMAFADAFLFLQSKSSYLNPFNREGRQCVFCLSTREAVVAM